MYVELDLLLLRINLDGEVAVLRARSSICHCLFDDLVGSESEGILE